MSITTEETGLRAAPSALPPPLDDTRRMVELLAEVLDRSPEQVRQVLHADEPAIGTYFHEQFRRAGVAPYVWSDGMARFYDESDAYLYGGVLWNRRPAKLAMRTWIGEYLARGGRPLDVLTIGDGLGCDSLYLAQWGHRVTFSELSPRCIRFARRLFAEAGTAVRVLDVGHAPEDGAFDVVLCLDVLEHVPDPPRMVAELASRLRPGGRLIVHAPFFYVSPDNPTHLEANRKYSGDAARLYAPHGLTPIDGRLHWDPLVLVKQSTAVPGPHIPWRKRLALRYGGLLLAVGRFWNGPHNRAAARVLRERDPRWERDLAQLAGAWGPP